jgi:protein SMG8
MSLFSIPRNKRFVYFNTDLTIRVDPLKESIEMLVKIIDKSTNREAEESEDDFWASISPYKGFAKPYKLDTKLDDLYDKKGDDRSFMTLLKEHVAEALEFGFDDSMAKFRGKSHFTAPNIKIWYDSFKILHKIFIENPDNPTFEANDPDYVSMRF